MSDSVLTPVKTKDPEGDARIAWEVAIRRVTDAKREDEVPVSDGLMGLGVDIAFRAASLSRESYTDPEAKKLLANLFGGKVYMPINVGARVNSLFAYRELTDSKNKQVKLAVLDKALRGLQNQSTDPIDYSSKALHVQTTALLKAVFALMDHRSIEFEGLPLTEQVGDGLYLNSYVKGLIKQQPNRYAAIIELVGNRRVGSAARVKEMLEVSESNAMMNGAL